jgi:hypothetical protein
VIFTVPKKDWPKYWDASSHRWEPMSHRSSFASADIENACSVCGWGRHMAIHCKPDGSPQVGAMGLHDWTDAPETDFGNMAGGD